MNSFYERNELEQIGFKNVGSNVLISKNASIYGAENIIYQHIPVCLQEMLELKLGIL